MAKLSVSNIAWSLEHDDEMYQFIYEQGFMGLEIAPTRLFPSDPYEHLKEAELFSKTLLKNYALSISSMQSIWYGRKENIFNSSADRKTLADYTKKAVLFAEIIQCPNLVFGCPKNRTFSDDKLLPIAFDFFSEIGEFAKDHSTRIALEPNPPFYGTNFINTTYEAIDFCNKLCKMNMGNNILMVNVDIGTMIHYKESPKIIEENIDLVNHIHISEPLLAKLEKRDIHKSLANLKYDRYFSIEMNNFNDIEIVKNAVRYLKEEVFGI
jgi:sugar phosphate isomerase/epimerase